MSAPVEVPKGVWYRCSGCSYMGEVFNILGEAKVRFDLASVPCPDCGGKLEVCEAP